MEQNRPDKHSFILGMITAFSECVAGGCKRLALSPPLSGRDYEEIAGEAEAIIEKHGLRHYHERNLDRPESGRWEWILIAGKQETLDRYLDLRSQGYSPMDSLEPFYDLLSYRPEESIHTGYDAYRDYFPFQDSGESSMFRPMLRQKQQLSETECIDILKTELRGVLSVLGDGDYPYGMPMNHYWCETDGKLYFHGGRKGHKIDAIKRHDKASFCVYDQGFRRDGEWALNIRSVIVFGRIELIEDEPTLCRISAELSRKFTSDEDYIRREIEKSGPRTLLFALVPEHMTGKLVNEA